MLKNSKLISESEQNYHIKLPSGHTMNLDKKGLNEKAHAIIKGLKSEQKFAEGGQVDPELNASQNIDPNSIENNFGAGMAPQPDAVYAPPVAPITPVVTPPMAGAEFQPKPEVPPTVPTDAITPNNKISNANKAFEAEKTAAQGMANVTGAEGAAEAKIIKDVQKKVEAMPTQQQIFDKYQTADNIQMQEMANKRIDPDHYWSTKSTGSKIAAGIGMMLGGLGAVAGQGNPAVTMIQNAIDRDIDAQKNDQSKNMNLWKMNRDKMGSELAANLATQNQLYTGLKYKIESAASQFKGPMAQQQAQLAIAQINQKQADNNYKLSLMNSGDGDPAMKVQFLVPPEKQKDVFDEIERAQNTKHSSHAIMEAFNSAATDVRPMSGGKVRYAIPGVTSPYVKALEAEMGPTFGKLEGTVRQAAMDNMHNNITPQFGDSEETIKIKRNALENYLKSAASAPTAKGFGIDLSKHSSTAPLEETPDLIPRVDPKTGKTAMFDGKTKQFVKWK